MTRPPSAMRGWLLALALAAALGTAHGRDAPMVQPGRVLLATADGQASGTPAVRAAILKGAQGLGWMLGAEEPGKLTLKFNKQGKHEVVIAAVYDDKGYELTYVDSTNMNFSRHADGSMEIHPNYNRWIANLIKHIATAP
ncbi:hypothetical protein [Ideonella sp.]|uniref:hypothetical protein n=1 Tax=Ideonella sp. TaxID=1929293 RepID=UPI0035B1E13D